MTVPIKTIGMTMAVSAAGLFAASVSAAVANPGQTGTVAQVHCYGVNACKGLNDCKTEYNECKGQGACKGQGYLRMSAQDCEDAGGIVQDDSASQSE